METFAQDLRYALRMLVKTPGFALVAVLTIALGIGANTVIFSVVDAVLLRSLPFRDPARLVVVWEQNFERNRKRNVVGPANFIRWREQSHVFEGLAAGIAWPMNLTGGPEPERLVTGIVSPNMFSLLGVQPVIGRAFTPEEEQPNKDNVLILREGYWRRRFGGDRGVIGRTVQLNGQPVVIVGVMPDNLKFPDAVDIWTPFTISPGTHTARGRSLTVVARLKPGVTVTEAQADMDVVSSNIRTELPVWDAGWGVNVVPLGEQMVGGVRQALLVLFGSVVFVLLIACANVANLLLARAATREREMAIRLALGAGRARIIRQLLTESVLLSIVGGLAGLGLAYWSIGPLVALLPKEVPAFREITINPPVLGFTFAMAVLTGIIFGIAPALRVSASDPQDALKEGGRGASAGRGQHRTRNGLVIAETAVALVLLASAGVLIHSFMRLTRVDAGFDPDKVLTMQVSPTSSRYRENAAVIQYFQQAVERVRAVPGVTSAAAISWLPLDGGGSATNYTVDDRPKPAAGQDPVADIRVVTESYFTTMGIQLSRGRDFNSGDRGTDEIKKVIVNRAMAESFWPGQDPIGNRITMEWNNVLHAEIIGVVADVKLMALDGTPRSALYWYLPQFPNSFMTFVVRTSGRPLDMASAVRGQIASVDPEQPIAKIRAMQDVVDVSVHQPRFTVALLGGFAGLALVLAGIGIYGVISYTVTQRTHELGVRLALGAQRGDIVRLIVKHGMRLMAAGLVIGVLIALAATRLLTTLLFDTRPTDPLAFVVVSILLAAVALLASFVPARRAARLDPVDALRYE